ncbi:MAG: GldG family protein [Firmicutes bacterium]|nr:GldG family protein [Bacillota bacterium]
MKKPNFSWKKVGASFSTRSFRAGGYSVIVTAVVLAIVIMINVLASALPASVTKFDTTSSRLFTLSQQTEQIVSGLTEDVTVFWIVRSGKEESYLETLLDRYASLSSHIRVVKKDPDVFPTFTQQYTDSFTENSLIVQSGERFRYVDYNDIFVLDYYSYYYYGTQNWSFQGESELTSAIDYVVSESLPKVYLLTGHGEGSLSDTFTSAVKAQNLETAELSLLTLETVPADADCILINAPQSDISLEEQSKLREYLGNGGNLFLITDPPKEGRLTNLEALMASYGVNTVDGIVVEGDQKHYVWGTPYYLLPDMASHDITQALKDGGYHVLLPIAQGLTVSDGLRDTLSVTSLLTTSASAFSKAAGYNLTTYEKEEGDTDGPFSLAVAITDTVEDGITSDIVWVSSAALVDDQANVQVSGGNQDFFLNTLSYLCQAETTDLGIHAKSLSSESLSMNSATVSLLTIAVVGVIPLCYLAVGIVIWARRKRR